MREGIFYSVLLILIFASCQKNPPNDILPPPSHSGKHTLGFFVNGKPWVPYDRGSHEIYELPKAKRNQEGSLKISATRIDDEQGCRQWFCIEINQGCFEKGKYQLSSADCSSPFQTFYYGDHANKPNEVYHIIQEQPHYIEVTHLNEKQQYIAGFFAFDAVSAQDDTLHFTSGRFDLKYE